MEEILRRILESAVAGFAGDQVMKRTGLGERAEGILDKIIPPAAASDASTIPQEPAFKPMIEGVPADRVMTQEEEQLITPRVDLGGGRVGLPDITLQEPTEPAMVDVTDDARKNEVQDFVRMVGSRAQSLMKEAPEGDPQGAAALATVEGLAAKGMEMPDEPMDLGAPVVGPKDVAMGQFPEGKPETGFFEQAGSFLSDLFGDEERMTRMALAFNSMRLQPDQGLANVLGKRLELIGTRRKANRTADALRKIGTPAAIKAAEYIEATGDAKGGYKMYNQAGQFVTGSGKELMETYGITGLVPNQPYRLDTITKKVEGIGGGATNVFAVKPDKGYMLVTDETTGGVKQVPIPGGKAAEAAGLREESKEVMTDIITDAANSIRNAMSGGLFPETGTIGSLMSYLGESDAAEVRRQVGVLTSQAQVETLNAMRQQSPTGGALGSVTERELSMLSSKAGAIDPRADAKTFLAAVDDYQRTLYRIVHGKQAGDEIYEREMAKYRQSSQQPTKQTITPEQAAAELARRRGQ